MRNMANEDWKLQVSYKTPTGDMINIRANTADELSVLLEGIGDYSTQISSVQQKVVGAYTLAPLSTTSSTIGTASGTAAPVCKHGARIWREGISKASGKPYAFWACPSPQGTPDQCKPVN